MLIIIIMAKKNSRARKQYRRRRANKNQLVQLGRSPIANTAIVKLRFCLAVSVNPAANGITGSHLFYVNNIFQPSVGQTTHQPLAMDQYSAIYSRYCVLGSRISVKPINVSATIPIMYGILTRQTSPGLAVDPSLLKEQGDSNWAYAGNINSRGQGTVSKNFSAKKMFGFPDPKNEADLGAVTSGSPAVTGYFQLWAAAADGLSDPGSTTFQCTIDYICYFSKPHALAQS
jgi:hypothetical protein